MACRQKLAKKNGVVRGDWVKLSAFLAEVGESARHPERFVDGSSKRTWKVGGKIGRGPVKERDYRWMPGMHGGGQGKGILHGHVRFLEEVCAVHYRERLCPRDVVSTHQQKHTTACASRFRTLIDMTFALFAPMVFAATSRSNPPCHRKRTCHTSPHLPNENLSCQKKSHLPKRSRGVKAGPLKRENWQVRIGK